MIIELAYMLGAAVAALVVGAGVGKGLLNREFIGNSITQIAFGGLFGYALATVGALSTALAIGVPVSILVSKVLIFAYFFRLSKGALSGKYGQETKWVAEMVKEDDEEFKEALRYINQTDRREIKIIAESKGELREAVIERAEENAPKKLSDSGN